MPVLARLRVRAPRRAADDMSLHPPLSGRITDHPTHASTNEDGANGAFLVQSPEPGWTLALIMSDGEGWDHVSVHAFKRDGAILRTPTWKEMAFVKGLCWDGEDVVIQYHPAKSSYVNLHPHVLHLWRPTNGHHVPVPPIDFV